MRLCPTRATLLAVALLTVTTPGCGGDPYAGDPPPVTAARGGDAGARYVREPARAVPRPAPERAAGDDQPARLAVRYGLLLTNYDAASYRSQYRHSVRLTAGRLRSELEHAPPPEDLLAQIERNRDTSRGRLIAVDETRRDRIRATVVVVISEQLGAGGKVDSVPHATVSEATLTRRGGGWRVTGWRQLP